MGIADKIQKSGAFDSVTITQKEALDERGVNPSMYPALKKAGLIAQDPAQKTFVVSVADKAQGVTEAGKAELGKKITTGLGLDNASRFSDQLNKYPQLRADLERKANDFATTTKYDDFLKKVGSNPAFVDKIGALAQKNPNADLDGLINMERGAPAVAPVAAAAEPARAKPQRAAPAAAAPSPSVAANQPAAPGVSAAPQQPTPEPAKPMDMTAVAGQIADMDDKEIVTKVLASPDNVKMLATAITSQATKMGVGQEYTSAFEKRIANDANLRTSIQQNLQRNPDFVRQMAKTIKDGGDMPDSMKEMAKKTMMDVMENPEKLADTGFVSRMTSGLKMKNSGMDIGGVGGMFGGMLKGTGLEGLLSGLGAFFQGLMDKLSTFMKEVTGGEWLSRRNSGRNFFQAFSDSMDQTPMRLASEKDAKQKMVVHPAIIEGKPQWTHTEPVRDQKGQIVKGDDGQPLEKVKPNALEITTISGHTVKALPATGIPAVRDAQGNYHMYVATGMDGNNRVTEVQRVVVSSAEFKQFNTNMQQYGDQSMPRPQVPMQDDNPNAVKRLGANVTSLGPNGEIVKTVNTADAAPLVQPQAQPVKQPPPSVARDLNEPVGPLASAN